MFVRASAFVREEGIGKLAFPFHILNSCLCSFLSLLNAQAAYEGMVLQGTDPNRPHINRACLTEYLAKGYVPMENCTKSVSLTLEYAYNDWAIAQLASLLNRTDDVAKFTKRAQNYRNVWDSKSEYFCPRKYNGVSAEGGTAQRLHSSLKIMPFL